MSQANTTARRPNILFLMTDQHRSDHVGWSAGARTTMPCLDSLAAQGAVFTRAVTVNPICTPARCALMTGKYTHQIGMLQMSGDLSLQHATYARELQRAGYWTAGVGKFHLLQGWPWGTPRGKGHRLADMHDSMRRFGFDHLWEVAGKQLAVRNHCDYAVHLESHGLLDRYRDHIENCGPNMQRASESKFDGSPWPFDEAHYVDNVTGDRVIDAIERRPKDRPFYLFASFCGPHKPYDPPASWLAKFPLEQEDNFLPGEHPLDETTKARLYKLRRAYKAMIACIDHQISRIVECLRGQGLLENTVILMTSDHGEMLGDRGRLSKQMPWRQSVQVPMMIRDPRVREAKRCDAPVEITDLTATILDLAGLDAGVALSRPWPAFNDRVPCRSLMPIVRGERDSVRDWAFSECSGNWQMLESRRLKFIRWIDHRTGVTRESLYDTQADPGEQNDLSHSPAASQSLMDARAELDSLLFRTPPAQTRWAPLAGEFDGPPLP